MLLWVRMSSDQSNQRSRGQDWLCGSNVDATHGGDNMGAGGVSVDRLGSSVSDWQCGDIRSEFSKLLFDFKACWWLVTEGSGMTQRACNTLSQVPETGQSTVCDQGVNTQNEQ